MISAQKTAGACVICKAESQGEHQVWGFASGPEDICNACWDAGPMDAMEKLLRELNAGAVLPEGALAAEAAEFEAARTEGPFAAAIQLSLGTLLLGLALVCLVGGSIGGLVGWIIGGIR